MRKFKILAMSLLASLGLIVGATSFVAASQSNPQVDPNAAGAFSASASILPASACRRQSAANSAGQDILLSTSTPRTYTGTDWQDVDCTGTTFRLRPGERAIVVNNFTAEADCNGKEGSNQWCQTRALLNGSEGAPVALEPSSFAFDSVAGGSFNWQAHSMNRGWEIRCGSQDGCVYKFVVQTRMHDASVTGMWLDEVAAHLRINIGGPAPM